MVRRPPPYDLEQFMARRLFGDAEWSHDGSRLYWTSNISGQFNLWRQDAAGGWPHPMTAFEDRTVRGVAAAPDGSHLLIHADRDGTENYQLYRLDLPGGWPAPLTDAPDAQHIVGGHPYSPDGRWLVYASNERKPRDMDVCLLDPADGSRRTLLAGDAVYMPARWSPDGKTLSVVHVLGNTNQNVLLVDVAGGGTRNITPHEGPTSYVPGPWSADGSGLYMLTNEGREFSGLAFHDLATGARRWIETPDWEVTGVAMDAAGRRLAWTINEAGYTRLFLRDLESGELLDLPGLPDGLYGMAGFAPDGGRIALFVGTATHPSDIYVLDLDAPASIRGEKGGRRLQRLTWAAYGNVPEEHMVAPELTAYETHDGRRIPGWLYKPRGLEAGERAPVVLSIHGGPEWQERPGYNPFYQYILNRGIGVFAPNVRGSTGYGRAYQRLIYRDWGGGELKDFEHAARYLRSVDWVDPARIAVYGGSFGGFATLSCASRLPEYWACAVDVVGPSNLLTFVESVPEHWKPFIGELVGDPEADRDDLIERSPITHADRIRCPLLVVQGANDPRVNRAESEQMVERLRARGGEVDYLLLEDEGHGITRRKNDLRVKRRIVDFLEKHLG